MPVLLNAADRPLFLGSRPTPFDGADGYPALLEPLGLGSAMDEAQVAPRSRSLEVSAPFFRKLALASAISLYVIIWSGRDGAAHRLGPRLRPLAGLLAGAAFPERGYHSFIEFGNRVVGAFRSCSRSSRR